MATGLLDVEIRHLLTFRTLAERLSFRATAAELGFAQSAISQHIVLLENRVGARLVERGQGVRGVRLTPAGELFLEHVDAILARVTIAEQEFSQRPVRVGVFQSVSATLLPTALAQGAPPADLIESDGGVAMLRSGALDVTFTEEPPDDEDVAYVELFRDPYLLMVPADDPRPPDTVISLEELAAMPLLTFRTYRSTCHFGHAERRLARRGIRLRQTIAHDDAPTLHGLVAEGVGIAILPRLAVNPADQRVRTLAIDEEFPARMICLAWDAEREPTETVRALIDAIGRAALPYQRAA